MTRTGEGEDTRGARGCPIAFKASRVPYPNTPQAALSLEGVGPSWSCLLLDRLARPDGRPSKGLSSSCAGREAVVACLQHTTGAVRHCCNYNKAVVAYLHISNTPLWNFQGAVLGVLEWRVGVACLRHLQRSAGSSKAYLQHATGAGLVMRLQDIKLLQVSGVD